MIDYDRSLDRKGFDFDYSIQKFGIDYDHKNSKKDVFCFSPKTVLENVRNITYLVAEMAKYCWD